MVGVFALLVLGPSFALLGVFEAADHKCTEEPANVMIVAGGTLLWLGLSAFGATVIGRRGSVSNLGSVIFAALLFVVAVALLTPVLGVLLMGDCATLPERYRAP